MPYRLLFLCLFFVVGCAPRPAAPVEEGPFRFEIEAPPTYRSDGVKLATLNTEFMFDGYGDEGQANFAHKGDPEAARAHRDAIGQVVLGLDADVIVLQEVENREVLDMLVRESLAGQGYTVSFVPGRDTFTGQDVGLLSRLPIDEVGRTDERVQVGATEDEYGVSKNVWARLMLNGVPTTLIGVHFLSQASNVERKARREAQAEVIRRLVEAEQAAGRAVAVLGDFNDYDEATPDLAASAPVTEVLATIKAAGPGADDDLRNVIAEVPQRRRFTALWDQNRNDTVDAGELTAIDHILLSPRLYTRLQEVHYVHAHDPIRTTDHFPIVVVLR